MPPCMVDGSSKPHHFHLLVPVSALGSPQAPLPRVFAKSKAQLGCWLPHWAWLKKSSLGSSHKKVRIGLFWSANWFCRLGNAVTISLKQRQSKASFVFSVMLTDSELMVTWAFSTIKSWQVMISHARVTLIKQTFMTKMHYDQPHKYW